MRAAEQNALRSIQNLKRHTQAVEENTQLRDMAAIEIPRVKYALSLYANISNIVWDYSAETVKGMITSPVGEPTKSFDIDPSSAAMRHEPAMGFDGPVVRPRVGSSLNTFL